MKANPTSQQSGISESGESAEVLRMAGDLVHALRTPLNAILGFASLLQEEDLTEDGRAGLAAILRAAGHLAALTDEAGTLVRLETGRLTSTFAPVDLAALLPVIYADLSPMAGARGVTLVVPDAATPLAQLNSDQAHLRTVITELLAYAIHYTRSDGFVLISGKATTVGYQLRVGGADLLLSAERATGLLRHFTRHSLGPSDPPGPGLALAARLAWSIRGSLTFVNEEDTSCWLQLDLAT